jgi:hypothetical protein
MGMVPGFMYQGSVYRCTCLTGVEARAKLCGLCQTDPEFWEELIKKKTFYLKTSHSLRMSCNEMELMIVMCHSRLFVMRL